MPLPAGVDDEGNTFAVSPDPMYAGLAEKLQGVKVGEPCNVHEVLQPVLSDAKIFEWTCMRQGWANMWRAFSLS